MDKSIKCECGNDKFWWIDDAYLRCTVCFNEYNSVPDYDFNYERWMRRFNKEENRYDENWEHFNPETFQQISDKGLESLSKDDSIVENAVSIQDLIKNDEELRKNPLYKKTEAELRFEEKGFILKSQVAKDCAIKRTYGGEPHSEWRMFWIDRWLFEEQIKRIKEFKEGLRDNITHIINNR